jgi:hypothetical protein
MTLVLEFQANSKLRRKLGQRWETTTRQSDMILGVLCKIYDPWCAGDWKPQRLSRVEFRVLEGGKTPNSIDERRWQTRSVDKQTLCEDGANSRR